MDEEERGRQGYKFALLLSISRTMMTNRQSKHKLQNAASAPKMGPMMTPTFVPSPVVIVEFPVMITTSAVSKARVRASSQREGEKEEGEGREKGRRRRERGMGEKKARRGDRGREGEKEEGEGREGERERGKE